MIEIFVRQILLVLFLERLQSFGDRSIGAEYIAPESITRCVNASAPSTFSRIPCASEPANSA